MTDERILEILDAHCLKGNCEADTRALIAAIKDILAEEPHTGCFCPHCNPQQ